MEGKSSPNRSRADSSPERTAAEVLSASKQAYTTEIVKALGGPSGDVVQDVACSFQRQTGRLYISTKGLFFYSNLFGFERRIRINYDQVEIITKTRTTSLLVKTAEGEEYVFRSFENREFLLEIIMRYHSNALPESCTSIPTLPGAFDKALDETYNDISMVVDNSALRDRRNEIQSNDSRNLDEESDHNIDARYPIDNGLVENTLDTQWTTLLHRANKWESAIVDLNLVCKTVEEFFDSFLQNNSTNSLNVFLRDVVGDSNIIIDKWANCTSGEAKTCSRCIRHEHKSGVVVAKATRQQTYERHDECHSCLKNMTHITGIKAIPCDSFFVEDVWFIEKTEKGVVLNVKFHVNFTKPTMLKSIIKNRATSEAREWYTLYSLFLRQTMYPNETREEIILPAESVKTSSHTLLSFGRQFLSEVSTVYCHAPVILIFGLALVIYQLQLRVDVLEGSLKELEVRLLELENSQFT